MFIIIFLPFGVQLPLENNWKMPLTLSDQSRLAFRLAALAVLEGLEWKQNSTKQKEKKICLLSEEVLCLVDRQ